MRTCLTQCKKKEKKKKSLLFFLPSFSFPFSSDSSAAVTNKAVPLQCKKGSAGFYAPDRYFGVCPYSIYLSPFPRDSPTPSAYLKTKGWETSSCSAVPLYRYSTGAETTSSLKCCFATLSCPGLSQMRID